MEKPRPVLNLSDLELSPMGNGAGFDCKLGAISRKLGAQKLGYNLTVVPPGKKAFPCHNHRVNEEMFFVLEGTGELRVGDQRYPIKPGDVIACPPGGPDTAHQIKNTGSSELRYLAVSTKLSPELVDYPDSKKFGLMAEVTGPDGKPETFRYVGRRESAVDYFDGEA